MLKQNPAQRPSVDAILRGEFVRGHVERYAVHVMGLPGNDLTPGALGINGKLSQRPASRCGSGRPWLRQAGSSVGCRFGSVRGGHHACMSMSMRMSMGVFMSVCMPERWRAQAGWDTCVRLLSSPAHSRAKPSTAFLTCSRPSKELSGQDS